MESSLSGWDKRRGGLLGGVGGGEEGVMDKDGEVGRGVNTSGRTESTPNPPTKKARQSGFVAIFTHPSAIPILQPSSTTKGL